MASTTEVRLIEVNKSVTKGRPTLCSVLCYGRGNSFVRDERLHVCKDIANEGCCYVVLSVYRSWCVCGCTCKVNPSLPW